MLKGRTLLGYDDKPDKRKNLKYTDWLIIIIALSPIWATLLIAVVVAICALFAALVLGFTLTGFGAVTLFVYSAFSLADDLWSSVMKMGICLFASGAVIIAVAGSFKGIKVFFVLLKSGYMKIKNMLLLKKLEEQENEQND